MLVRTSLLRIVFASLIALAAVCVVAPNANAQDKQAEKKEAPAKSKKIRDIIDENVKDLSDEQKEKLTALQKKAAEKQKVMLQAAEITWKMFKQRREAVEELTAQGLKGKAMWAKANESAGYNDKQSETQSKVGKVWDDYRFATINVLSAEQQKRLPESIRKTHAAKTKAKADKAKTETK